MTLGGTGKVCGDRHLMIGDGAVVLNDVPARKENPVRLDRTLSHTMDHTSHMSKWSDYVIQRPNCFVKFRDWIGSFFVLSCK